MEGKRGRKGDTVKNAFFSGRKISLSGHIFPSSFLLRLAKGKKRGTSKKKEDALLLFSP
jgi:hypothetical protein